VIATAIAMGTMDMDLMTAIVVVVAPATRIICVIVSLVVSASIALEIAVVPSLTFGEIAARSYLMVWGIAATAPVIAWVTVCLAISTAAPIATAIAEIVEDVIVEIATAGIAGIVVDVEIAGDVIVIVRTGWTGLYRIFLKISIAKLVRIYSGCNTWLLPSNSCVEGPTHCRHESGVGGGLVKHGDC